MARLDGGGGGQDGHVDNYSAAECLTGLNVSSQPVES